VLPSYPGTAPGSTNQWGELPFGGLTGLLESLDTDKTGTVTALAQPDDAERAVSLQDDRVHLVQRVDRLDFEG